MPDLDQLTDELYAGAPETFVARRAELVHRARAGRDRPLAQALGALRRPTRTAWLVNLLSRRAAAEVAALLDLADALRTAQADRDGARLRDLSAQRRRGIDTLTRRAVELGREYRYTPTETTLGEVAATLQAALADSEVALQVRRGRLATAAVYGGFGTPSTAETEGDLMAALAASIPASGTAPANGEDAQRAERRERERRRREALARQRDEARAAFEQARDEAERATGSAAAQAERVERRRAELAEAERSERAARTLARSARERARELQQAADAAEHAYREVESGEP